MDVQFVASFSPIVVDLSAAKAFYQQALGLSFEGKADDYVFTERLAGVKHFGLWPLTEAAQACYGQPDWPRNGPVPQASLEFELASPDAVPEAAAELAGQGYRLIHDARTEPWGQVIARLLGPEGMVVGLCYTPWFHQGAG
jgi:catechol 2,3-dioxygenase-like lactoylglutathione lyase family enzyme